MIRTDPKVDATNGFFVAYFERVGSCNDPPKTTKKQKQNQQKQKEKKGVSGMKNDNSNKRKRPENEDEEGGAASEIGSGDPKRNEMQKKSQPSLPANDATSSKKTAAQKRRERRKKKQKTAPSTAPLVDNQSPSK